MSNQMNQTSEVTNALTNDDLCESHLTTRKLTQSNLNSLSRGNVTEVDGFTHYHFANVSLEYEKNTRCDCRKEKQRENMKMIRISVQADGAFNWKMEDLCCFPGVSEMLDHFKRPNDMPEKYNNIDVDAPVLSLEEGGFDAIKQARRNQLQHSLNGNIARTPCSIIYVEEHTAYIIGDPELYRSRDVAYFIDSIELWRMDLYCLLLRRGGIRAHVFAIPRWCFYHVTQQELQTWFIASMNSGRGETFVPRCVEIISFREQRAAEQRRHNQEMHALNGNIDCKENTKRNSKTIRSCENTRIARLSSADTELSRKIKFAHEKFITKKRQEAAHKAVMKQLYPTKHFNASYIFGDEQVNFGLNSFETEEEGLFGYLKDIIDSLPEEVSTVCDWAEFLSAAHVILCVPAPSAKILAIRTIYRIFGIKGLTVSAFVKLAYQMYQVFCNRNVAVKASDMKSSISVLVTLILSLIFQRKPGKNQVDSCLESLRIVPQTSRGLDCLVDAIKGCVKWVKNKEEPCDLNKEIDYIEERVIYYTTPEGNHAMDTNPGSFTELAELEVRSITLLKYLAPNSQERLRFSGIAAKLNMFYRRVQMSPPAGYGNRKPPVTLHLWGDAGVGKTHIINLVSADALSTILKLEGKEGKELHDALYHFEKYMYYNPVANKYKTNYNCALSKIFVCDDANQVNAHFLKEGQPFPVDLIHYANSHTHLLNVAELENKRNAHFNSALIVATDNTRTPVLDYMASADAYKRRIDLQFCVKLKTEYACAVNDVVVVNNDALDHARVNKHIWRFEGQGGVYDYDEMIEFVHKALIAKHEKFVNSCKVFKEYAIRNTPRPEPMTVEEKLPENNNPYAKFLKDGERVQLGGGNFEETATQHSLRSKLNSTYQAAMYTACGDTFSSNPYGWYHTQYLKFLVWLHCQSFFQHPLLWSYVFFCVRPYQFFQRVFKRTTVKKRSRAYKIAAVFGMVIAGYGAYRCLKKKKRVISLKRGNKETVEVEEMQENEVEEHNKYNPGDASHAKPKPKGKTAPTSGVVSRPLFHSKSTFERFDAKEFGNSDTPEKQLESCAAFVLAKLMCSNMYIIQYSRKVDGELQVGTLRGFFIKGSMFLTNRHLLEGLTRDEFNTGHFHLYNVFNTKKNIEASKVDVITFLHKDDEFNYYDLIAIDFKKTMHDHVDLTSSHANNTRFYRVSEMHTMAREKIMVMSTTLNHQFETKKELSFTGNTAWYVEIQHTSVTQVNEVPLEAKNPSGEVDYTYNTLEYPMHSVPGSCGSVVLGNSASSGGRILGIHMAGFCFNDKSFAQIISHEMIESLNLAKHVSFFSVPLKNSQTVLDNTFNRVGNIPHNLHSHAKSKIYPSIFHNKIFATEKKPAYLGFFNGEHVVNKALKKYMEPSIAVSSAKEAIFLASLRHKFAPTRKIRQLTHEESISGIEGHEYIRGINRASSPGYPFNQFAKGTKGKTAFLGADEMWIYDHPMVLKEIADYKRDAENNVRPRCYFVSTAKDELRPIAKVDAGKTRAFAAAPLNYVITFREHYLDLFANIMEERIENSSLVGINPYSEDWDYLALKLKKIAHPNAKQFIATDFTNWDGTLNRDLLWMIHSFIEMSYSRTSKVSEALWNDITSSRQVFGNVVIQIVRGQPSGNPGTAIINTLYNYGITYLCIYDLLENIGTVEAYKLQENLVNEFYVAIYGDDSIIAFSRPLSEILDITKWSECMLSYGHYCTPETKDGEDIVFKTMHDISIIKRKFVYDSKLHMWLAPLELASILEPLNWDRCEQEYGQKQLQMQVNSRIAIRELCMHTPEIFTQYRDRIIDQCEKHRIVLTPDCFYPQETLRKMVRRGDNVFYFADNSVDGIYKFDFSAHPSTVEGMDTIVAKNWNEGIMSSCTIQNSKIVSRNIYSGGHSDGSPIKVSHTKTVLQFYPTKHVKSRVAETLNSTSILPFHDERNDTETGQQIVTFATSEVPIEETLPMEADLRSSETTTLVEGRSHTIDDILKREYQILTDVIPIGGAPGDQLYLLDPIELFLSQPNVHDKINGFAFLRTFLNVRFEFTVAPKTSGGIILAFYADMNDVAIANRTKKLIQISQTPNIQLSLTTSTSVVMKVPWVSSFMGRNLQTGTGRPGKLYVGRLTPLDIGTVKLTVYIQADNETLQLEYPTIGAPLQSRDALEKKIKRAQLELRALQLREEELRRSKESRAVARRTPVARPQSNNQSIPSKHMLKTEASKMVQGGSISGALNEGSKIARAASGLPLIGGAAGAAAPILSAAANVAGALGYSKPSNDAPVTAVKWKQGDGHLASQAVMPDHVYSLDQGNVIATDYPAFSTDLDEMSVDYIMRCPNILDDKIFKITDTQEPRQILQRFPLTINPIVYDESIYLSQQAWVSAMCQNWIASLHFDFDVYLTMFHNVKLRFLVAINDYGSYEVGDIMDVDAVNKGLSEVVQFTADNANIQITNAPMATTPMKYVATPFSNDGTPNISTLKVYQDTEFCSYGTLYVLVEVPLEVTGDVSHTVYCVPKFHCSGVGLSNPSTHLQFLPAKHMIASKHSNVTLTTDFQNNSRTQSQVRTAHLATGPSVPIDVKRNLAICMGDQFDRLDKILTAFVIFGPTLTLTSTNAIAVDPYHFRAAEDSESIDVVDYFSAGYGFYTGSMAMRMLMYENQGYVGESFVMSKFANQWKQTIDPTGYHKFDNAGFISTGVRCIPHFAQEGVIDVNIPYYQAFNIARVSHAETGGSWGEGHLPIVWYFKSSVGQKVKFYRAVKDKFKFGFLTSLPPFNVNPNGIIQA